MVGGSPIVSPRFDGHRLPTKSGHSSGCNGVGMHVGSAHPNTSRSLTRRPEAVNMRQADEPQSVE